MKWLLANPLKTLPPLGLVAVGALVGVAGVPVVKKTARSLAVITVRGALAVNDAVKGVGSSLTQSWEKMVDNAREQQSHMNQRTQGASTMSSLFSMDEPQNIIDIPSENEHNPKTTSEPTKN